jgi:YD repeat-containing protein
MKLSTRLTGAALGMTAVFILSLAPLIAAHYYGGSQGTVQKFYDGADRLVEVIEPTDEYVPIAGNYTADLYPWLTRYLYDLTENGQVAMQYGSAYYAHGNLFKTQRYLPATVVTTYLTLPQYTVQSSARRAESAQKLRTAVKRQPMHPLQYKVPFYAMHLQKNAQILRLRPRTRHPESQIRGSAAGTVRPMLYPNGSGQWMDVGGTAYDALDRKIDDYRYLPGGNVISTRAFTFDSPDAGLLNRETTPVGDQKSYSYDGDGRMSAISFDVSSASTYTPQRSYTYDPDGRIASVGNSQFGTWTYQYDADGRLSASQEPSGGSGIPGFPYASGTITSPASFSYTYYADGMPSTVNVSGAQSFSENDSYRGDGSPTSAYYSVIGSSITRQYTYGGRPTQRTDPTATDSISYDAYGRQASLSMPSGSLTQLTYDPEGELTSFAPGSVQGKTHLYYTATGQLEYEDGPITMGASNFFLDGTPLPAGGCCISSPDGNENFYQDVTVDTRNLLVIGSDAENTDGTIAAQAPYDYDADGRILDVQSPTPYYNGQSWGWMTSYNDIYTYDAEDHTMTSGYQFLESSNGGGGGGYVGANPSHYYAWGPNGHPVTSANSSGVYQVLHWDHAFLSYTSRSDGSVNDYKLGPDADVLPGDTGYAGVTYYDGDSSGNAIANHNASGHSNLQPYAGQSQPPHPPDWVVPSGYGAGTGHQPTFSDSSGNIALTYNREDGVSNGEVTIQGVRNFSGDTQQWTTPDAYQGVIHDPMSQARYMWNNNNPVAYSDPTGYCPGSGSRDGIHVMVCVYIPGSWNGAVTWPEKGDNRGPERKSPGGKPDSRATFNIDFGTHNVNFYVAHSTAILGKDMGQGSLPQQTQEWHGARSVTVTMQARCGGCPSFDGHGPSIYYQATFTLNNNGSVSVSGITRTQFPAFEGYEYGGKNQTLFTRQPTVPMGDFGLSLPFVHN